MRVKGTLDIEMTARIEIARVTDGGVSLRLEGGDLVWLTAGDALDVKLSAKRPLVSESCLPADVTLTATV